MDISKLLPLLMNNQAQGKDERTNALLKLAQGEKPDIGAVMNMAMSGRGKARPMGLKAVCDIASYEIIGKLVKYFL